MWLITELLMGAGFGKVLLGRVPFCTSFANLSTTASSSLKVCKDCCDDLPLESQIRFSDYLGCLRVKHLLGSEQSLHVCDQKQYPGVVEGWQFVVEL